jgi:hypothetical protein
LIESIIQIKETRNKQNLQIIEEAEQKADREEVKEL